MSNNFVFCNIWTLDYVIMLIQWIFVEYFTDDIPLIIQSGLPLGLLGIDDVNELRLQRSASNEETIHIGFLGKFLEKRIKCSDLIHSQYPKMQSLDTFE